MKQFTFKGTVTTTRNFEINIVAKNSEQAEEMARELLEEDVKEEINEFTSDDAEVEIDIDEMDEESISTVKRYRDKEYEPVA